MLNNRWLSLFRSWVVSISRFKPSSSHRNAFWAPAPLSIPSARFHLPQRPQKQASLARPWRRPCRLAQAPGRRQQAPGSVPAAPPNLTQISHLGALLAAQQQGPSDGSAAAGTRAPAPGRGARPRAKPQGGHPSCTASLGGLAPSRWEAPWDRPRCQQGEFPPPAPPHPLQCIPAIPKRGRGRSTERFTKPGEACIPAAHVGPPEPAPESPPPPPPPAGRSAATCEPSGPRAPVHAAPRARPLTR